MSSARNKDKILQRSGTGQSQRFIKTLDPNALQLNDFEIEDWLLFAFNFAKHVNYYDAENATVPLGNWQDFFNQVEMTSPEIDFRSSKEYKEVNEAISDFLVLNTKEANIPPHLTLFICFLQLLEHSKERFNTLTKRHLDFYYQEILQVDNLEAKPDQVHLIFELAKKSIEQLIPKQSLLNAGKDLEGMPLQFETDSELVVNQTRIAIAKNIFNDIENQEIKMSLSANTLDGISEPLPDDSPYWLPFGYPSKETKFIELPDATIGFAIASPILALQEGLRTIKITVIFDNVNPSVDHVDLNEIPLAALVEVLQIECSGLEEWIVPSLLTTNEVDSDMITSIDQNALQLVFQLPKDAPAFVAYNQEILLERFNTSFPIARFHMNTKKIVDEVKGHRIYRALVNRTISEITIEVDVKDARLLSVENDNGPMPVDKPFYPFTTRPLKRSKFYMNYPEVFQKNWTELNINISWNNTPDDFRVLYEAYSETQKITTKRTEYLGLINGTTESSDLIVENNGHFKAQKSILTKEEWQHLDTEKSLFTEMTDSGGAFTGFECDIDFTNGGTYEVGKAGPVRLSLNQTFLHELFPRFYALALTSNDASNTLIPNEPYTPLVGEISLNYKASETRVTSTLTAKPYDEERIRLFHIHPFGQAEEHEYLKTEAQNNGVSDIFQSNLGTNLVPKFCNGGSLYLGLENAEVLQSLSVLIQVLEGSENPVTESFQEGEEINWSILCNNRWKSLKDDILENNTDNFLSSGIVKFNIPKQATKKNTLLPQNYIWIRAQMRKNYDAICKVIGIHAQAIAGTLNDNNNDLTHLQTGLPADTISKLVTRIPQIKSVSQPYSSFGGLPEESDLDFYRRISERIRHKNRGITLWDNEHIVLQQFPQIYKVKCLNHTINTNFIAAGEVTLVVIPDMVNKNVFDVFQPRVSTATLNKISDFINERNTMHVMTQVINPNYEEVKVDLEVQFYEGYDVSFYKKKLAEDIKKLLSPWAFEETQEITFGITLQRSMLINYLEKLDYVDYLQNVLLTKNGIPANATITPSNPTAILVSSKTHTINTVTKTCNGEIIPQIEICQT